MICFNEGTYNENITCSFVENIAHYIRVFALYTKLAMLAFLYCLNLKIGCIEKSVT